MNFNLILCSVNFVILIIGRGDLVAGDSLWCFKCSWESQPERGNNITSCNDVDETKIPIGVAKKNPLVHPHCQGPHRPGLYDKKHGYEMLKQCHKFACPATGSGARCAKWTFYYDDGVFNVTMLCAVSKETGCFTQQFDDGFTLETCLCNDGNWCNFSISHSSNKSLSLIASVLLLLYFIN